MGVRSDYDFYLAPIMDERKAQFIFHKFGRNESTGTVVFEPVAFGGIYRMPQVGSETFLRVKAGDANDSPGGSGAQEITILGLGVTGAFQRELLETGGALAGPSSKKKYLRMFRAWVTKSGTYANNIIGSHAADIVIENEAGTEDWATIPVDAFPRGQTGIGFFSVPLGFECLIYNVETFVDSKKEAEVIFFQRRNMLQTVPPYSAKRMLIEFPNVTGGEAIKTQFPFGPFPPLTDLGFMAKGTAIANVSIDYEIVLIREKGIPIFSPEIASFGEDDI